ncbi:Cdc6-related protein, AAA superfamily ATPase [Pilibacter termitis]|uniref:Cdc6-related protein, AAA superfamily ATPase n=1 Tax=Pilibacter termitis TaxID=263852 RepID=A0A1T4Q2Y7_9ENTE|nr:ATP-binding protein [Pilibacter termitis]SJZ98150.1 Cdc6-related protein, AAA superfamily ATPase [Pilibacter termitis]
MIRNPFNPQFGKIPPFFIGRQEIVAKISDGLNDTNSPYRTTLVSGMRGSGKTSLITDIAKEMNNSEEWLVVNVPMNENLLVNILGMLYKKATPKMKKIFDRLNGVSFSALGFSFQINEKSQEFSYQVIFTEMLEILKENGISLLITIDEIQNSVQLREFASMYQVWIREEYDIAIIMTGLPHQISELQNEEVLTFLLRSKRVFLEPIHLMDIHATYQRSFASKGITFETEAIDFATKSTKGYAYVFQLLGYYLWEKELHEKITKEDILTILPAVQEELFRNVISKVISELSDMDIQFLEAMSKNDLPVKLQTISEELGKPNNYLANYRARLLDCGIIISPRYAYLDFSIPFMKEYFELRKRLM